MALDMMCAAGCTTVADVRAYVDRHQAWTGVQQAREAVALADAGSRSPQESRLRLVWVLDAARPRPLANHPVFDLDGRLLGYPDLLDPVAGVVGEYDGEDHRSAEQHSADVDREGRLRDHDLEVFRVTGRDLPRPHRVTDRIHSAYRRARRLPAARRTWTLTPPPGWVDPASRRAG